MLILLQTSLAIGKESQKLNETYCYSTSEVNKIAEFKKECDFTKLELKSNQDALQKCLNDTQCSKSWTEDKTIVGAGFITSFIVGFIIASSVKK